MIFLGHWWLLNWVHVVQAVWQGRLQCNHGGCCITHAAVEPALQHPRFSRHSGCRLYVYGWCNCGSRSFLLTPDHIRPWFIMDRVPACLPVLCSYLHSKNIVHGDLVSIQQACLCPCFSGHWHKPPLGVHHARCTCPLACDASLSKKPAFGNKTNTKPFSHSHCIRINFWMHTTATLACMQPLLAHVISQFIPHVRACAMQNARNVLVTTSGSSPCGYTAKLADLGLSRIIKQHNTHHTTCTVGLQTRGVSMLC